MFDVFFLASPAGYFLLVRNILKTLFCHSTQAIARGGGGREGVGGGPETQILKSNVRMRPVLQDSLERGRKNQTYGFSLKQNDNLLTQYSSNSQEHACRLAENYNRAAKNPEYQKILSTFFKPIDLNKES